MDKIAMVKNEIQLQIWSDNELSRQESGLTVAQLCKQEKISKSAYYYRLRKIRENLCEQIPVPVTEITKNAQREHAEIRIVSEELKIEISSDVSSEKIAAIFPYMKDHGVILSRTTMANWIICIAEEKAKPIYELMKANLLSGRIIHADETIVQALHEPERSAKTQSRMCGCTAVGNISCCMITVIPGAERTLSAFSKIMTVMWSVMALTVTTNLQRQNAAVALLMSGESSGSAAV